MTVEPAGTCISSDSAFNLMSGVASFMGSICEPNVNDVRLKFSVTSAITTSTVSTDWSPYFNVTGEDCCLAEASVVCSLFHEHIIMILCGR